MLLHVLEQSVREICLHLYRWARNDHKNLQIFMLVRIHYLEQRARRCKHQHLKQSPNLYIESKLQQSLVPIGTVNCISLYLVRIVHGDRKRAVLEDGDLLGLPWVLERA